MEGQFKGRAGHIYYSTISKGAIEVRTTLEKIGKTDINYVVVDTLTDGDLDVIAELPNQCFCRWRFWIIYRHYQCFKQKRHAKNVGFTVKKQKGIIITGSCSKRTNEQVDYYKDKAPSLH